MTEYAVSWAIDTDRETPLEAAEYALDRIRNQESIAHIFTVTDKTTGAEWEVDFDHGKPDTGPEDELIVATKGPKMNRIAYHSDESFTYPDGNYALVKIEENVAGYVRFQSFTELSEAQEMASLHNTRAGLSEDDVLDIRASSMTASRRKRLKQEFIDAVAKAEQASHGYSNDREIEALQLAVGVAREWLSALDLVSPDEYIQVEGT